MAQAFLPVLVFLALQADTCRNARATQDPLVLALSLDPLADLMNRRVPR